MIYSGFNGSGFDYFDFAEFYVGMIRVMGDFMNWVQHNWVAFAAMVILGSTVVGFLTTKALGAFKFFMMGV